MVRLSTIGFILGIVLFFIPVPPFAMIASIIVWESQSCFDYWVSSRPSEKTTL